MREQLVIVDVDGVSLLHWLVRGGHRREIAHLLTLVPIDIDAPAPPTGDTPLMLAARSSLNAGILIDLLRGGASRDIRNKDGLTALQIAVQSGAVLSAFCLLANGADPEERDSVGETLIHWLFRNPQSPENVEMVRLLLKFGGSLRTYDAHGDTCMHILAAGNFNTASRTVRISKALFAAICLHENDSIGKMRNRQGLLPYKLAVASSNFPVLNFLIDLEAFHRFPYSLPIILNSITVPVGFLGLHFSGWIGGFVAFLLVSAVAAKFSQATIEIHGSRASFGRVWGLVVSMSLVISHLRI